MKLECYFAVINVAIHLAAATDAGYSVTILDKAELANTE